MFFLRSNGVCFADKLSVTTGEEDASPEVPEGMSSVAVSLYDLDLVVQAFTWRIGFVILPCILDVRAVMPDGVSTPSGAVVFGRGIFPYPIGKVGSLDGVFGGMEYHKKLLVGIKGFPKLVGELKQLREAFSLLRNVGLEVMVIVELGCCKKPCRAF